MLPGHLRKSLRGHSSYASQDVSRDTARIAARTLRDLLPYLLIRGWCLTKLNGFRFLKAARDDVRLNVHKWRDDVADSHADALRKGLAVEREALSERS